MKDLHYPVAKIKRSVPPFLTSQETDQIKTTNLTKRHKPNIYKYTVCNYLYGSSIFDCVLYTKLQKWRICNSKMYLSKKKVLSFDVLMFFQKRNTSNLLKWFKYRFIKLEPQFLVFPVVPRTTHLNQNHSFWYFQQFLELHN